MSSVSPICYYGIVNSMFRYKFLYSVKTELPEGLRATLNFQKFKVALILCDSQFFVACVTKAGSLSILL